MKKLYILLAALAFSFSVFAKDEAQIDANGTLEVTAPDEKEMDTFEFTHDAGADIVSHYLWRGMYNGGLSFQPTASIGWDSKHTGFSFGVWGNVGASDWLFRKESSEGAADGTYFVPEIDVFATLNVYGVVAGFTHYYYFGGSPYFCFGKIDDVWNNNGTSQTEVTLGYDFSTLLDFPLSVTWNTMIAGDDGYVKNEGEADEESVRAYSSYIELTYTHEFDYGMSLTGQLGMTPWKSTYTGYEGDFAVNNITLKFNKEWELADFFVMDLYAQLSLNTYGINKNNVYVNAAGDDKYDQKLNFCLGAGFWF